MRRLPALPTDGLVQSIQRAPQQASPRDRGTPPLAGNCNRIGLPGRPGPEKVLGAAGITQRYTIHATEAADGVVAGAALRTGAWPAC